MLKKIYSAALVGLSAEQIEVEADISPGLPTTVVVGLPDAAIRESRERVKSALKHSGFRFPKGRVAVNLAPADLPKIGTHYDLPIAISLLLNSSQIAFDPTRLMFAGELSLDGRLRPINGALVIAEYAKQAGFEMIFLPKENALEASLVTGLKIIPVRTLPELIKGLIGVTRLQHYEPVSPVPSSSRLPRNSWDFRYIKGQELAKRALEIAAAGAHNVLMSGPPGSGKTLLARAMATILPALTYEEALETTKIYSVAGIKPSGSVLILERPFRSPHHTSSAVSLVGGGSDPRPGEITLAHRGVLFLDEFPEYTRQVLESMRQPLEDGQISVARASKTVTYPAKFILVAAKNPCPCGYASDPQRMCVCTQTQLLRYQKKLSGPLLDRIDLHVEVPRLPYEKIEQEAESEGSQEIQVRVEAARARQRERFEKLAIDLHTNSEIGIPEIKLFCRPEPAGINLLKNAVGKQHLSARAYHRVLKLARTIADLSGEETISQAHIAEALVYRPKDDSVV